MHILILDDDKNYAAMVASACKKLGHRAQVRINPSEALSLLQDENVDVVLVDLDMPQRPGTEVVHWLRAQGQEMPIAFCTGTCQDQALIDAAGVMARVLPKVWTHADLKVILDALYGEWRDQERKRQAAENLEDQPEITMSGVGPPTFARGTGPGARAHFEHLPTEDMIVDAHEPSDTIRSPLFAIDEPATAGKVPEPEFSGDQTLDQPSLPSASPSVAVPLGALRRNVPRVRINCVSWSLVRRLCEDLNRGQRMITVHVKQDLQAEDDVMVAIALPDEMVVSIGGRVRDLRGAAPLAKGAFAIELTDFGSKEISYLLSTCDLHEGSAGTMAAPAMPDTNPTIPLTQDSVDLDEDVFQGEARISWNKPPR